MNDIALRSVVNDLVFSRKFAFRRFCRQFFGTQEMSLGACIAIYSMFAVLNQNPISDQVVTLSMLFEIKFFSSFETKMIPKIPIEPSLRTTQYIEEKAQTLMRKEDTLLRQFVMFRSDDTHGANWGHPTQTTPPTCDNKVTRN